MLLRNLFKTFSAINLPASKTISPTSFKYFTTSIPQMNRHYHRKTPVIVQGSRDLNNRILNVEEPTLIEFYSADKEDCKKLEQILLERYNKSKGRWQFVRCDVDRFPEVADAFYIGELPTMKLHYQGKFWSTIEGIPSNDTIDDFVKTAEELGRRRN